MIWHSVYTIIVH